MTEGMPPVLVDLCSVINDKIYVSCVLYALQEGNADKSLARPGRKQANVSVGMEWISFGALSCRKKKTLMKVHVSMLLKSRASLTCFRACFLPGRAKDLSARRYMYMNLRRPVTNQLLWYMVHTYVAAKFGVWELLGVNRCGMLRFVVHWLTLS